MKYDWYEAWTDESSDVPYVLFVFPDPDTGGKIIIIDPKDNNKVVHEAPNYEIAKMWLLEDEYTQIVGRVTAAGLDDLDTMSGPIRC